MNQTIKTRIEQIGRGEVPEGYKKTKLGVIPQEWEMTRLSKYLRVNNDKNNALKYSKEDVFSISGELGIVNQIELLGRSYAGVSVAPYGIVYPNNIVYTKSPLKANPYGIIKANKTGKTGIVSTLYAIYHCKDNTNASFVEHYFGLDLTLNNYLYPIVNIGAKHDMKISDENALKGYVAFPSLVEQERIAEILGTQDKLIALKEKRIAEKKQQKKYLMQQLLTGKKRLPGFTDEWKNYEFNDLFTVISTKKNQINKSEYLNKGQYPVIDQGKVKIVGYSNDEQKLYRVPWGGVIVFGDHTREVKYIDFDFIIGADGTQTLTAQKEGITFTKFMYYLLANKRINSDGYSRHFKYVKEFVYKLPIVKEQQAIADILSQADKEIELLQKDLEEEKQKKKALMQLLLTGIVRVV